MLRALTYVRRNRPLSLLRNHLSGLAHFEKEDPRSICSLNQDIAFGSITTQRESTSRAPPAWGNRRVCRGLKTLHQQGTVGSSRGGDKAETPNTVLKPLENFLQKDPDVRKLDGYIHKRLDRVLPSSSDPLAIYEAVWELLVSKGFSQTASTVYKRMTSNGFVPSDSLNAKVAVMALDDPSCQNFSTHLHTLLTSLCGDQFSQNNLVRLLRFMWDREIDPNLIGLCAEAYMDAKGKDFIPSSHVLAHAVKSRARTGNVEGAFNILERHPGSRSKQYRARSRLPYIWLLSEIKGTQTWNQQSVARVLDLMRQKDVPFDIRLLNSLLAGEARSGSAKGAMSVYSMIKELAASAEQGILSDASTYGCMFSMYRKHNLKVIRHHHSDQELLKLPPWHLFRDFWEGATRPCQPIKLTTTLMNVILKAFARQWDYVALHVVLTAFATHGVHPDNRSYYIIVKPIVRRMWKELEPTFPFRWSLLFLDVTDPDDVVLNETLVENILHLISQPTFDLTDPLYKPGLSLDDAPPPKFVIPTLEMMETVGVTDPRTFDVVPLQRLLERAILSVVACPKDIAQNVVNGIIRKCTVKMLGSGHDSIPQQIPSHP